MRERLTAIRALACLIAAAACEGSAPPAVVEGPLSDRRPPYTAVGGGMIIGENSTAIIPGTTYDPETVVSMEWSLSPEPPDPDRRRGTIHVPKPETAVFWTAYINPVPPRSDYAITFTATNRRGVRRDTVIRTGIAPSVPAVSVASPPAPGDTVRGTVRLAVTVTSREQIINLDVLATDSTLLQWTPEDGQAPAWPRHTPFTMPLRVTLPTTPGRYTLRVRALDRAGVTGLSPALPVVVR